MAGPSHLFAESEVSTVGACDYAEDWKEYRRLRRKFSLVWLGYVPGVGLFAMVVDFLFHTYVPAFIFAFAWGIWFLAAASELAGFQCPRCGENFGSKRGFWHIRWGPLARKCQNCGLRKFAQSSDE
jgi:hypothetical protein